MAPTLRTRTVPKRSAIAPANGWPKPQSRFCSAIENAKTSRPQLLSSETGVMKNPREERRPNVSTAIRHPQTTSTAGVRQVIAGALIDAVDMRMGSGQGIRKGGDHIAWEPATQPFLRHGSNPPAAWLRARLNR